jgi:hypothetical protein
MENPPSIPVLCKRTQDRIVKALLKLHSDMCGEDGYVGVRRSEADQAFDFACFVKVLDTVEFTVHLPDRR